METNCPFCNIKDRKILIETDLVYAVYDNFPVSKGHVLIIPKRHEADYFNLTNDEQNACTEVINEAWALIDDELKADGYNIGINVGEAAGQTVMHVHIHLIPRYNGDVEKPRGGVRGVIPNKQSY